MADVFRQVGGFYTFRDDEASVPCRGKVLSLLSFKILQTLVKCVSDTSSDVKPSTQVSRSSSIRAPYEAEIRGSRDKFTGLCTSHTPNNQ